jgi:hypothetical protein
MLISVGGVSVCMENLYVGKKILLKILFVHFCMILSNLISRFKYNLLIVLESCYVFVIYGTRCYLL